MSQKNIPAFADEAGEAAWWDNSRDRDDDRLAAAIAEGRVKRGSIATRLIEARGATVLVVQDEDTQVASALATGEGLELKEYLAAVLHEALQAKLAKAA